MVGIARENDIKASVTVLSFALFCNVALGALRRMQDETQFTTDNTRRGLSSLDPTSGPTIFDVTAHGAKADGTTDNREAFMQTWNLACKNEGATKMVIPKGELLVGPVVFQGPCKGPPPMVIEVEGTLKAVTDISEYPSPEWFSFESIVGLTITGSGTFDGQGNQLWKYNDCKLNPNCAPLPTSLKFTKVNDSIVEGITSLNSQLFHIYTYGCNNSTFRDIKIIADGESPNTDGIHLSTSSFIDITSCTIGTGDDCVAIGQGTHNITVTNTTCDPGHGFSVGSLGKYPTDQSVSNIYVKNCTLRNTMFGARIKTWSGNTAGTATTIIYEDIIVDNVKNPIIIDQDYGRKKAEPSKWKVSDIHFRNFKGTSVTNVGVTLACSSAMPCEGIELANIDLSYGGNKTKMTTVTSSCSNAKTTHTGVQNPPPCSGAPATAPGPDAAAPGPDTAAPGAS